MKIYEYIGVAFAALGFGLLSSGFLFAGFIIGILSCGCLIPYFKINKQFGLFTLQLYFLCANILGMVNNWGIL